MVPEVPSADAQAKGNMTHPWEAVEAVRQFLVDLGASKRMPDVYATVTARLDKSVADAKLERAAGVEERDELRAIVREVRPLVNETFLAADAMTERAWERFLKRIDAALAPRDSAPQHKDWCALFGNPEAGKSCDCRGAPRDSGKEG